MNEREKNELVTRYLARLQAELTDVPPAAQRELIEDVRSHIEEAWAASPTKMREDLEGILAGLGDPRALAREERDSLGIADRPEDVGAYWVGVLAIASFFASIFLPLFTWPVALVLTWLSRRWATRDKVAVTAALAVALLLFLSTIVVANVSYTRGPAQVVTQSIDGTTQVSQEPNGQTAAPAAPSPWLQLVGTELAFLSLYGAPLASGIYLATRMRPHPRRPRYVALATGGTLVALALAVAFISPVQYTAPGKPSAAPVPIQQVEVATPGGR